MCQAFSCIVTKNGETYYKVGLDSHDVILDKFHIQEMDDEIEKGKLKFARVEIIPKDGYLHPEGKWTLKIDERITPTWWSEKHNKLAYRALAKWKDKVYASFNLAEALNPINPLRLESNEVTMQDIEDLKKWDSVRASVWDSVRNLVRDSVRDSVRASVWDSVGDSVGASVRASVGDSVWDSVRDSVRDPVWASVGDSVWDSVWDSVGAYIGSLFPSIKKWKYIKHAKGEYPYQCCVDLWKRGFVPSFDGKSWRLHAGKDAKIVYTLET